MSDEKCEEITTLHGTFSTRICPKCEPTVGYLLRQLNARCATHVKIRKLEPGRPVPQRALSKEEMENPS